MTESEYYKATIRAELDDSRPSEATLKVIYAILKKAPRN